MPPRARDCNHARRRVGTLRALCVCATLSYGCAYSLIVDGAIDPDRLQRLAERTAEVSDVAPAEELAAETLLQAEIPAFLEQLLRDEYPPEEIESMQRGLETLGLWPPGRDYVDESLLLVGEELAGLYVPEMRTLYVIEDFDLPVSIRVVSSLAGRDFMRELVLAHEIVHAYQHRDHPDLYERIKTRSQGDMTGALQAAVEGDATRYGFAAMAPDGAALPDPEDFRIEGEAEIESKTTGAMAEAPALLRLTLAFPYTRGYELSMAEGHAVLEDPPAATEQVLHADRRRASFQAIDLSPLAAELPGGCSVLYVDTLGELGMSVLLRDLGDDVPEAAWDGWDGDRFVTASCETGAEFLWWTEWDSDADAQEFAQAYRSIAAGVQERGGLAAPPEVRVSARRVLVLTPALADRAAEPEALARRARVTTAEELLAHFGDEATPERPAAGAPTGQVSDEL